MKNNGSYLAGVIDSEYQKKKRAKLEKEFIKTHCTRCKKRHTMFCSITQNIYGDYQCVEFQNKEVQNEN